MRHANPLFNSYPQPGSAPSSDVEGRPISAPSSDVLGGALAFALEVGRTGVQVRGSLILCPVVPEKRVEVVGLTREVETPLPSNSPPDHMILREELVDEPLTQVTRI